MTRMIVYILDRLILLAAFLTGGALHGFILNYRQRIGGHLNQALMDLSEFQKIANHHFQGSLERLISNYATHKDPSVNDIAITVKTILNSCENYEKMLIGLKGNIIEQLVIMARFSDPDTLSATWELFEPTVTLSLQSIEMGCLIGLSAWSLSFIIFALLKKTTAISLNTLKSTKPYTGETHGTVVNDID